MYVDYVPGASQSIATPLKGSRPLAEARRLLVRQAMKRSGAQRRRATVPRAHGRIPQRALNVALFWYLFAKRQETGCGRLYSDVNALKL